MNLLFWRKKKDKNIEGRNPYVIRQFDEFIANTQFSDRFIISDLDRRVTITDQNRIFEGRNWVDELIAFFTKYGYAIRDGQNFSITERGNTAKELGGHLAFQKYRKAEINLLKYQRKINGWLIFATILAGFVPLATFTIDRIWFGAENKSQPQPSIRIQPASSFCRTEMPKKDTQPSKQPGKKIEK